MTQQYSLLNNKQGGDFSRLAEVLQMLNELKGSGGGSDKAPAVSSQQVVR